VVRLLGDGGQLTLSGVEAIREIAVTARRSLRNLIHNRKKAWLMGHFPPGAESRHSPNVTRPVLPTEKGSGPRAP